MSALLLCLHVLHGLSANKLFTSLSCCQQGYVDSRVRTDLKPGDSALSKTCDILNAPRHDWSANSSKDYISVSTGFCQSESLGVGRWICLLWMEPGLLFFFSASNVCT